MAKRQSQCRRILAALRTGPKSNRQLNQIAYRYSARIKNLRDLGVGIDSTQVDAKTGRWVYTLTHDPYNGGAM